MKKVILLVVLFLNSIVFAQFSTDGLLVGYRFAEGEELKSVNHSADLTQTGNSLVSVNDRFGRKSALKLNGDQISRPSFAFGTNDAVTIAFWIKTTTNDANERIILDCSNRTGTSFTGKKGLSLSLKSGQITGVIQGDSYGSDLQVSFTDTRIVNDGNWHHIAFRAYNNFPSTPLNSVRLGIVLFIDGTTAGAQLSHPVSTGTFGSYFVSEKFSIGDLSRGGLTSANKYQDEIDDLGVYNVLTSTSDINTYLINPTNLSIAYPINNLVAEHKLDNPNVFKDEQSTAINFIQTGNVSQISNRFGNTNKAISLNGAYLTRPSVAYGISDAITYSFWMKTTTNDNNRRVIFDHSNRNSISDLGATSFSGRQGISVVLRNGILQGWVSATTATGNDAIQGFSSTVNVADDAWHMIALRVFKVGFTDFRVLLDIDGVSVVDTTYNGNNGLTYGVNENITIATFSRLTPLFANRYIGALDDFLIYDRQVTNNEIFYQYHNYIDFNTTGGNTLGLNNFSTTSFSVYPNPVQNTLTIQLEDTLKKAEIYTLLGEKVLESTSKEIYTNNLAQGIYILKVATTNGKVATQKIIKQ